jgi:flagellar motor switch protein FliM
VTLGGRGEDAVAIRYRMEALKRSGDVILVLPQRAIARIAAPLSEPPTSAPRRVDPQWTRDFEHRVTGAEIALQAFTEIADLRLADVAAFRQGQVLTLPPEALQDVTLTAEGRRLFTCELGQSEGRYSLRVAAEYDPEAASRKKVHALGY